jgi:hypothetical protein
MVPTVDFESLNGTLDGVVAVSLVRPDTDPTLPAFSVSTELTLLEARVRELATKNVRASEEVFSSIRPFSHGMIQTMLQHLGECSDFVLKQAASEKSMANRELAVRYWRIFTAVLGLESIPSSHHQRWVFHAFASFMGVVWKKRGRHDRLAATTVEQQMSQVRMWLREVTNGAVDNIVDSDVIGKKIIKGLKVLGHGGIGVMYLPHVTFRFMQDFWFHNPSPINDALRLGQAIRFCMMRRISEVCATTNHYRVGMVHKDERYLLHKNVWSEGPALLHCRWPKTKNNTNLVRPVDSSMDHLFSLMIRQKRINIHWLAEHPDYDPNVLPFVHVEGKPLHRSTVDLRSKELMLMAVRLEPGVGHLSPDRYRFNTHSERKGGAIFQLSTVSQIESYVRFMGDWKSLSFFDYAKATRMSTLLASESVGRAFSRLFG